MLFDEFFTPTKSHRRRRVSRMPPMTTSLPRKQKYRGHVRSARRDDRAKTRSAYEWDDEREMQYIEDREYERDLRSEAVGIFY